MPLDPSQQRAVDCITGPLVVRAGPGTGKTRVVTRRIAHQVTAGVTPPSGVLAVTFTDKAAKEMRTRLERLGIPAGGASGVRAATFHSAALTQVRHFWPRVSGGRSPDVLASKAQVLGRALRTAPLPGEVVVADIAAEIEWVKAQGTQAAALGRLDLTGVVPRWHLDVSSYAAALRIHDGPWPKDAAPDHVAEAFARLFDVYETSKQAASALDFDDLLAVATALIVGDAGVATDVRGRYTHLTVDEFQDTTRLQWDLLCAWAGERDDVCVVGDAAQAIYGFTGASPAYLERFSEHFRGAQVVRLERTYRSTQPICDLASRLVGDATLSSVRAGGTRPTLVGHDGEDEERAYVVDQCRRLQAAGMQWERMAVLYRFNAQSEPWEAALAEAGIPYRLAEDGGFFARRHVAGAITVLAEAARAGLDREDHDDPRVRLDDVTPSRPPLQAVVERLLRQRLRWSEDEPAGESARERWRDLMVIVELSRTFAERSPEADLAALLTELRRRAAAGQEPRGGGVALLTLHRAKGLEFDAVFVVSVEEGRLPSRHAVEHDRRRRLRSRDLASAVAEERRLLYVGMTRARDHLHVTWTQRGSKRPSRFVRELHRPSRIPLLTGRRSGRV